MKRRDLLKNSAALGFAAAAVPFSRAFATQESAPANSSVAAANKLKPPASDGIPANGQPLCVMCSMTVEKATAPTSSYKGTTYYFCSTDHKGQFDAAPEKFVALIEQA